tara:strand:+ start:130 stop:420 length:291 start_codon:yes stop_codon:yes gene_type:complete
MYRLYSKKKQFKMRKQELPKWFNGTIYEKGAVVENRFSGEEYKLNNIELSMYDFVNGANFILEMTNWNNEELIKELRKGLDWFRKYSPEAYMTLLD